MTIRSISRPNFSVSFVQMKVLVTALLLLICTATIRAQLTGQARADSLEKLLPTTTEDSLRIELLFNLELTYGQFNHAKAILYGQQRLQLAERSHHRPYAVANSLIQLSLDYALNNQLDSGVRYAQMADSVGEKLKDIDLRARVHVNLGYCYEAGAKHVQALDAWLQGLALAEKARDSGLIPLLDINVALIFYDQGDFPKARHYLEQGLPIAERLSRLERMHDGTTLTKLLEMLADVLVKLGDFHDADAALHQSLQAHLAQKDSVGLATVYSCFSGIFDSLPRGYDSVLFYSYKAKAIWDRIDSNYYMAAAVESNIANAFYNMAMDSSSGATAHTSAEKHRLLLQAEAGLLSAARKLEQDQRADILITTLDELKTVQATLGDYPSAYKSLSKLRKLSDSIYSQENKNKLAGLEEEREVAARDKQLQINAIELKNQRRQRWFLIGGLILLMIIGALLYRQSRTRKKTNTVLLQLNTELDEANEIKTRFFGILNHDLRAPVSNLINFLRLQQDAPDLLDEQARAGHAQRIRANAENLLETMEDLLLWSKGQMKTFQPQLRPVAVADLFADLKNYFSGISGVNEINGVLGMNGITEANGVTLEFDAPADLQITTDEHYLKTIMRNLTNNAVRALDKTPDAKIAWKAWEQDGKSFLSITDNGPGATDQQLKALYDDSIPVGVKTGLGLHVVRDLARAISCLISVHSRPGLGTEFRLAL